MEDTAAIAVKASSEAIENTLAAARRQQVTLATTTAAHTAVVQSAIDLQRQVVAAHAVTRRLHLCIEQKQRALAVATADRAAQQLTFANLSAECDSLLATAKKLDRYDIIMTILIRHCALKACTASDSSHHSYLLVTCSEAQTADAELSRLQGISENAARDKCAALEEIARHKVRICAAVLGPTLRNDDILRSGARSVWKPTQRRFPAHCSTREFCVLSLQESLRRANLAIEEAQYLIGATSAACLDATAAALALCNDERAARAAQEVLTARVKVRGGFEVAVFVVR